MKSPAISLQDVVVIAMLACVSFAIEISVGLVLVPIVSGIPLIGGTLSAIPDAMVVFLGAYLVPRRGGILLFATMLLTLSTVTPSFGPPGAYKVAIGVALGLLFELFFVLLGRRDGVYLIATATAFAASIPVTYEAWRFFGLPGADLLRPQIPLLCGIYFVEGLIGSSLGLQLYRSRLGRIRYIQRVRERPL